MKTFKVGDKVKVKKIYTMGLLGRGSINKSYTFYSGQKIRVGYTATVYHVNNDAKEVGVRFKNMLTLFMHFNELEKIK